MVSVTELRKSYLKIFDVAWASFRKGLLPWDNNTKSLGRSELVLEEGNLRDAQLMDIPYRCFKDVLEDGENYLTVGLLVEQWHYACDEMHALNQHGNVSMEEQTFLMQLQEYRNYLDIQLNWRILQWVYEVCGDEEVNEVWPIKGDASYHAHFLQGDEVGRFFELTDAAKEHYWKTELKPTLLAGHAEEIMEEIRTKVGTRRKLSLKKEPQAFVKPIEKKLTLRARCSELALAHGAIEGQTIGSPLLGKIVRQLEKEGFAPKRESVRTTLRELGYHRSGKREE